MFECWLVWDIGKTRKDELNVFLLFLGGEGTFPLGSVYPAWVCGF